MVTNQQQQRIAFFLPALWGGGAERVFLNLANGLSLKGYPIDFILAQAEGSFMEEVHNLPKSIRVIVLNQRHHKSARTLSSLPALVRYLRSERPTALLSGMYANIIALWAQKFANIPTRVVISEHNTFSSQNQHFPAPLRWLMLQLVRVFYPWADQIIAVSKGAADDLARVARIPSERITTIYNPIITPDLRWKANIHLDHPWFGPNKPPVIISIGRLTEQKDFGTLILAFAKVQQSKPARLMILGEGEERPALEALVKQLGMEHVVSMPGFIQNPYPYLAQSALYVLSSKWEGLPTALVEALYCGLPVIATDCPSGPREILQDGQYGLLVPVGNLQLLERAILAGLEGNTPRPPPESLGRFELETILDRYVDVLMGV